MPIYLTFYNPSPYAGETNNNMSAVVPFTNDGLAKSPEQTAIDAVHELLHTLMLDHPTATIQADEFKGIKHIRGAFFETGGNMTEENKKLLFNNIMEYEIHVIDDISVECYQKEKGTKCEWLSPGQLDLVRKQISVYEENNEPPQSFWDTPGLAVPKNDPSVPDEAYRKKYQEDFKKAHECED